MAPLQVIPVAVIFGPTACGKTALAAHLFASSSNGDTDMCVSDDHTAADSGLLSFTFGHNKLFEGAVEIISADSVQVYRDMSIGSAQPPRELLESLPHHLIGICDPQEEFSVADFVSHADTLCQTIYERGKLPVILGGTAFYIRHFMYGMPITPQADLIVRKMLQEKLHRVGAVQMRAELERFDPISAAKIHINDKYRIIRAHEVYIASGRPLSSFETPYQYRSGYRFCPIFLNRPRDVLYRRIEARVDEMFAEGLVQEVRWLIEHGCTAESPGMKAIGYHEFFELSPTDPAAAPLDKVIELIKRNSKRYAKRQQTFFQSFPNTHHIDMTEPECMQRVTDLLQQFLTEL